MAMRVTTLTPIKEAGAAGLFFAARRAIVQRLSTPPQLRHCSRKACGG
jgi:hypothetical protein